MPDVIIYETYREERSAIKRFIPKGIKVRFISGTIQENPGVAPSAQLISVRTQSMIPLDTKGVKAILTRSQGYDHIVEFCRKTKFKGKVGFLGSYCARSVAEQAVMNMLMLLKKSNAQQKQFNTFNRDGLTGFECKGRKACVVGVGRIGGEIARLLKALGLRVKGVDIVKRLKNLDYVSLAKGIDWADVLFCALALTEKTRNMLNYNTLSNSRKGLYLINVSRGEITPTQDMKRLLDQKILKGLALDVFENEPELAVYLRKGKGPLSTPNRALLNLMKREDVILTPHNAFNTKEALEEKARRSARSIEMFIKKGRFPYPIRLT